MRWATIPETLSAHLAERWSHLNEKEKGGCATAIQRLSTYFQQEKGPLTPWQDPDVLNAYLFYFFPLNLARAAQMLKQLKPLFQEEIHYVVDMGSGLGNFLYLQSLLPGFKKAKVYGFERDLEARKFSQSLAKEVLGLDTYPFVPRFQDIAREDRSMAFFSYSWIEMKTSAKDLKDFDVVMLIEPSTQDSSRTLQAFRQDLKEAGFHLLAPCTHEKGCPLLLHSKRDFCHDRVHFQAPEWFRDLESRLPMKNQTITFSYLVASKTPRPESLSGLSRVIGDTLAEKGKVRQAVCQDDQRRFLSWLRKENPTPPQIDHGALVRIESAKIVSNELRNPSLTVLDLDSGVEVGLG